LDEAVRQESYGAITEIGLEPIVSGGIFKVGRAPGVEDTRWISAVVVRKGGITFVTQRLQVVE
ncbi:MAG: nuclear transport factor 2 family protein, partial [Prochlorothrix sp.]